MRQTPLTASVLEIADGPRPVRDSGAQSVADREATLRGVEKTSCNRRQKEAHMKATRESRGQAVSNRVRGLRPVSTTDRRLRRRTRLVTWKTAPSQRWHRGRSHSVELAASAGSSRDHRRRPIDLSDPRCTPG